jgi:hypothetical protein
VDFAKQWGTVVRVPSDEFMIDALVNNELYAIKRRMLWLDSFEDMNNLILGLVQTNKVHWKWDCTEFGSLYWMEMMNSGTIALIEHHKTLLKEDVIPWTWIETSDAIRSGRYDCLRWTMSHFSLNHLMFTMVSIVHQIRHWRSMQLKDIQLLIHIAQQCRNAKVSFPHEWHQPQTDHLFKRYDKLVPSRTRMKKWFRSRSRSEHLKDVNDSLVSLS